MRTVYLTPDHSSWWLLSPGITLYFDELCIARKDHQKLIQRAGDSSYHEQLALHYERFTASGTTQIKIIEDTAVQSSAVDIGEQLANELLQTAKDYPDFIDPQHLIVLARNSFLNWIQYNERKLQYLREEEQMYSFMSEQLASWNGRLDRFNKLLELPKTEAFDRFCEDRELLSTFSRLVTSATRCIELTDKGLRIYDPMLDSYMPMIELLEGYISAPATSNGNALDALDAYAFRMSRYGEVVPVDLGMDGFLRTIDQYADVRRKLEKVDDAFESIQSHDLRLAFESVKKEISPLVREVELASRVTEYAFWGVGLKYDVLSWLALPVVTDKLKSVAGAFSLITKRVGKFAGAYALITEQLLLQQDLIKSSCRPRCFDPARYSNHYRNFLDRKAGDTNAV